MYIFVLLHNFSTTRFMTKRNNLLLIAIILVSQTIVSAQGYDPLKKCFTDGSGNCVPNTLLTAVPFLRIVPDARSGAMGDVGIAIKPDANSLHFNAANWAFAEENSGLAFTYTPWLQNLNLDDIFLLYLSGYYKLNKDQAIGGGIRYFSLGEIPFTDGGGFPIGTGRPREFEATVAYARKLGDNFSASLSGKFILSDLASGQNIGGQNISNATSVAADIGLNYRKKTTLGGYKGEWSYGLAITNIGAKVSYIKSNSFRDVIPTNFGLGTALSLDLDDYNSLTFALDINKLMVPSPQASFIIKNGNSIPNPDYDVDTNKIADYREQSLFTGMTRSFGDAQGGFSEELKELSYSIGMEYWYDKQFAFRGGYYYENALKGNRRFFTLGVGVKYNIFGINLSYLVPTSNNQNPLDNTLRFSMLFDFSVFNVDSDE
jgi:Type IX secretion system protein PorV